MTSINPVKMLALVGAGALLMAGCSSSAESDTAASASAASASAASCPVTLEDGWVKATDAEMTGAFGTLSNSGDADASLTSASSPVASKVELHEVVDSDGEMVMQPVEGGFTVPASGEMALEPGGYHIMLMGLTGPIAAGDEVEITLNCEAGGSTTVTTQAKDFTGGEETYEPTPAGSAMADTEMSE